MIEAASFADVIDAIREHTAHLLGTTISYDDGDWATPTALPEWTRSHVAAHLVEGALSMLSLVERLDGGAGSGLHPSVEDQRRALERRALDAGLSLQIQLDETSGLLQQRLAGLADDDRPVPLGAGWTVPAHCLATARLREVVVHHYDLVGPLALDVSPAVAHALLELEVSRPHLQELPSVLLVSDEGFSARIGVPGGDTTTVIGPANDLLIALARGVVTSNISGATDLEPHLHGDLG